MIYMVKKKWQFKKSYICFSCDIERICYLLHAFNDKI